MGYMGIYNIIRYPKPYSSYLRGTIACGLVAAAAAATLSDLVARLCVWEHVVQTDRKA